MSDHWAWLKVYQHYVDGTICMHLLIQPGYSIGFMDATGTAANACIYMIQPGYYICFMDATGTAESVPAVFCWYFWHAFIWFSLSFMCLELIYFEWSDLPLLDPLQASSLLSGLFSIFRVMILGWVIGPLLERPAFCLWVIYRDSSLFIWRLGAEFSLQCSWCLLKGGYRLKFHLCLVLIVWI